MGPIGAPQSAVPRPAARNIGGDASLDLHAFGLLLWKRVGAHLEANLDPAFGAVLDLRQFEDGAVVLVQGRVA